jgi:hypothetical protein
MSRRPCTTALGAALLGAMLALPAAAQRAAVDAASGRPTLPDAAQKERLLEAARRAANRPHRPHQPERLADGSDRLEHDPSMMNYTVVRLDAAGRLQSNCVNGAALAARFGGLAFAQSPLHHATEANDGHR